MTPQEIVGAEQNPTSSEEPITIEAPNPEAAYVPICDPSFAYGPWPYPDYPAFFPVFAGVTIGGCGWITGPIIAPFVLNFRTRHIEIDRKRLALFDRDRDRERDRDHALVEEWRHDPGHRGNVPYRDAAVSAKFGGGTPAANVNPAFRGRWTGLPPVVAPRAVALPQEWRPPGIEGARPPLDGGRRRAEEIRIPPEGGRSTAAGVQARFGAVQPALDGVDPTGSRTPDRGALSRDAEGQMLIERELFGRVRPTALAPPPGGWRGSPSFGGIGSTQPLGDRRSFRPLVGVGAQPFGARGPNAIGAQPFSGRGPQTPSGGMRAGGSRGGG
jgi:Protein of unknown function (DUF3300)